MGVRDRGPGYHFEECGLATRPYSPHSTNNARRVRGRNRALEQLRSIGYAGEVVVEGDSQLVVRQMNGEYEVRAEHLKAYHDWLGQLARSFPKVEFRWVPREENAVADALSKRAVEEAREDAKRHRPVPPFVVTERESASKTEPPSRQASRLSPSAPCRRACGLPSPRSPRRVDVGGERRGRFPGSASVGPRSLAARLGRGRLERKASRSAVRARAGTVYGSPRSCDPDPLARCETGFEPKAREDRKRTSRSSIGGPKCAGNAARIARPSGLSDTSAEGVRRTST